MKIATPPTPTPTPSVTPELDLTALMLQVVAEKTGYPVDMLELGMDLEGDLGIDSIKRVEILAAVDERAPGLSTLDRSRMASLHTLAEIVDYLQGQQSPAPAPVEEVVGAAQAAKLSHESPTASTLARYRLERIPAPAAGMAQPGLRGGDEVWITGDATIGACLVDELRRRGANARLT